MQHSHCERGCEYEMLVQPLCQSPTEVNCQKCTGLKSIILQITRKLLWNHANSCWPIFIYLFVFLYKLFCLFVQIISVNKQQNDAKISATTFFLLFLERSGFPKTALSSPSLSLSGVKHSELDLYFLRRLCWTTPPS